MFVTSINFRGTFKSSWDLIEVSEQSWYKVLTYELVNPTFKISPLKMHNESDTDKNCAHTATNKSLETKYMSCSIAQTPNTLPTIL